MPHVAAAIKQPEPTGALSVSPTGSTLVVFKSQFGKGAEFGCIQLDGNSPDHWMPSQSATCAWLDAKTFIALGGKTLKAWSLQKYTTDAARSTLRNVTAVNGPPLKGAYGILAVSKGRVVGISNSNVGFVTTEVTLFELNINDGSPIKSHIVSLPEKAYVAGMSMSPNGSRIAWHLIARPEDNNAGLLASLFRRLGVLHNRPVTSGVWISDADGKGFYCVGHMDMLGNQIAFPGAIVQWTPDGGHLSYMRDDRMYIFNMPL
jgi:hypothetical protein